MRTIVLIAVAVAPFLSVAEVHAAQPEPTPLSGTAALVWTDDLSVRVVDEAHRLLDRKTAESVAGREKYWHRDFSSPAAYAKSVEPNRQRFKRLIGVVDPRVPVVMERYGDENNPALVAQTEKYRVWQVRWSVLDGVTGEGLLLEPEEERFGQFVVIPDADQTPEQVVGLAPGIPPEGQIARRCAESGFRVIVPVLISRACDFSGNPQVRMTNQPHREWIYRQAFELGRHVIGFEVQKVLAAVDWLKKTAAKDAATVVAGHAEGGLIAFYAAAVDPRIDACLVDGYFDSRQRLWEEPIYRNVFGLLREFGDAQIAGLIAPHGLLITQGKGPHVDGPPPATAGRSGGAAPGKVVDPAPDTVRAEARRAAELVRGEFDPPAVRSVFGETGVLASLAKGILLPSNQVPKDARKKFDPQARQKRQVEELTNFLQRLQRYSDRTRDEFFLNKVYGSGPVVGRSLESAATAFIEGAKKYRELFWKDAIGELNDPLLPPNPKTRKIYDEPKWAGYEVVLDVFPELHSWGILCLPKDIKPGQRRPVVVCQHGLEGVPSDVIVRTGEGFHYYHAFAAELAEQGFVTFAPYNLYRGGDRFRLLQRKANPLGMSLFSIIARQHEQILNWLGGLPQVDKSRIAFYGLSYGGKSAMRLPALLPGYCLSICSGDFNDWVRKITSLEFVGSYMFTPEWEIFEFDLGSTFNYAEMSYLIFPRPFMVERGHHDGVGLDPWVSYEYAKVRWLYANLGQADKTEIEYFNGPHCIHGVGTYEFLHKHLAWPKNSPK
jgi:dienelactone hydrolase